MRSSLDGFAWLISGYNNTELLVEVKEISDTHQVTGIIVQRPIQVEENMVEEYKKAIYFDNGQTKMEDGSQVPEELATSASYSNPSIFEESFDTATFNVKRHLTRRGPAIILFHIMPRTQS